MAAYMVAKTGEISRSVQPVSSLLPSQIVIAMVNDDT